MIKTGFRSQFCNESNEIQFRIFVILICEKHQSMIHVAFGWHIKNYGVLCTMYNKFYVGTTFCIIQYILLYVCVRYDEHDRPLKILLYCKQSPIILSNIATVLIKIVLT